MPGSRPSHAHGGPAWAGAQELGIALAHFPGEISKVLLLAPPPLYFPFPSLIRVLFIKKENEDTTQQEITTRHFSKSFKNIQHVTFFYLHTFIVGTVDA